jgi:hypothetical protein
VPRRHHERLQRDVSARPCATRRPCNGYRTRADAFGSSRSIACDSSEVARSQTERTPASPRRWPCAPAENPYAQSLQFACPPTAEQ